MTITRNVLYRTLVAVARRRLARVLVVVAVAAAGVLTVSGAASASASPWNPIVNAGTNKCLDVRAQDGYYNVGARVQQWNCTGVQEQQWRAVQINSIDGFHPTWEIVSQRSGLCLGRGAFAVDGQQAIQMPCDGSRQVGWYAGDLGDGNHDLVNIYDSRVLDLSGQSSADGAKVQLWPWNGSFAQRWRIVLPVAF